MLTCQSPKIVNLGCSPKNFIELLLNLLRVSPVTEVIFTRALQNTITITM